MPTARRKAAPKAKPAPPKVRKQTLVQLLLPNTEGEDYRVVLGPQTYTTAEEYNGTKENTVQDGNVQIIAPCGNEEAEFKLSDLRDLLEQLPT